MFVNIPTQYELMKASIQNKILINMYSRLQFLYLPSNLVDKYDLNNEEKLLETPLFHFFKANKLITYQLTDPSENLMYSLLFDTYPSSYFEETLPQKVTAVICFEGKCVIIESIKKEIIIQILNETKSVLINVSKNIEDKSLLSEIQELYKSNTVEKKNNIFLQLTYKPVSSFFIRRHFYPSYFFKDTSFFSFDQKYRTFDLESKKSISNLLLLNNQDQFDDGFATFFSESFFENFKKSCFEDDGQISIHKFSQSDFVFLRKIFSNDVYNFYLAIHIESLYIFMVKKLINDFQKKGFDNEYDFCEKIKHRCITRFYGFFYEENRIKGFVYEFMCNGPLDKYILNNKKTNQSYDLFIFMTICRLFQGLNHLHSNQIIHRDLKPSNILLDHDFIPYLSDFDKARDLNEQYTLTNDYGADLYSSPEQENGEEVSKSTDIYSFGLIVYFLFEKKDLFKNTDIKNMKKYDVLVNLNAPKNFQEIVTGCLKHDEDQRITNNEILKRIYKEVYSFEYLENFLFKQFELFNNIELVNYLYENYCFVYRFDKNIKQLNICISFICQYIPLKIIKETRGHLDFLYSLAYTYINDKIIEHNYPKAIKYLKYAAKKNHNISIVFLQILGINDFNSLATKSNFVEYLMSAAKRKDSDAIIQLANLYLDGNIVQKNVNKAIELYTEAVELGNPKACLLLGNFYLNSLYNEVDYGKAIYFLNVAAQKGNPDALLNLGDIYYEGKGVAVDYEKAFQYYNLSAIQNNLFAMSKIGDLYSKGQGVKQNNVLAIKNYESSLKIDFLGEYKNINLPQQQLYFIKKRIEEKYHKFKSETYFKLGGIYLFDTEGNFNLRKAIECFEISANLNYYKAQYILGYIY